VTYVVTLKKSPNVDIGKTKSFFCCVERKIEKNCKRRVKRDEARSRYFFFPLLSLMTPFAPMSSLSRAFRDRGRCPVEADVGVSRWTLKLVPSSVSRDWE
jgi:hypothetical protein